MLAFSIDHRQPGLAASLALHILALICASLFVRPPDLPSVVEPAISVELVTLSQLTVKDPPSPVPVSATPDTATSDAPATAPAPVEPEMIHATRMLAGTVFADPRNAEAREMLGQLDATTLREQVCGVEAMEQIHAFRPAWHPVAVVAYAFADALVDGDALTASGAAVLIGEQWRELRFVCTLAPDLRSVVTFDFWIGDIISEQEKARYGLAIDEFD